MLADDFRNHLNGHRQFLLENAKSERDSFWKEAVDEAKRDTTALVLAQAEAQNSKAMADIVQKAENLEREKEHLKQQAGEQITRKQAEAANLARQRNQLAEIARKNREEADARARQARQAEEHANNIKREAEEKIRQAYVELNRMAKLLSKMKSERDTLRLPPGEPMEEEDDEEPEIVTPEEEISPKAEAEIPKESTEALLLPAPKKQPEVPKEKEEEEVPKEKEEEEEVGEGKRKEEGEKEPEEHNRTKKRTKQAESENVKEEIKVPEVKEEKIEKPVIEKKHLPSDPPIYTEKAIANMKKLGYNPAKINEMERNIITMINQNPDAALYAFGNPEEIRRFQENRRGTEAIMQSKIAGMEKFIERYKEFLSNGGKK